VARDCNSAGISSVKCHNCLPVFYLIFIFGMACIYIKLYWWQSAPLARSSVHRNSFLATESGNNATDLPLVKDPMPVGYETRWFLKPVWKR
jgi:hypothetical protein